MQCLIKYSHFDPHDNYHFPSSFYAVPYDLQGTIAISVSVIYLFLQTDAFTHELMD